MPITQRRNIPTGRGNARQVYRGQNLGSAVVEQMRRRQEVTNSNKRRRGNGDAPGMEGTEDYFVEPIDHDEDRESLASSSDGEDAQDEEDDAQENVVLENGATTSTINRNDANPMEVYEEVRSYFPLQKDFSIVEQARKVTQNCVFVSAPVDYNEPLWNSGGEGDDVATTKGEFIRGLFRLLTSKIITPTVQQEIYSFLRTTLPRSIHFPATIKRTEKRNRDGTLITEYGYEDYAEIAKPDYLTFDVCRNGCFVFVGSVKGQELNEVFSMPKS